MFVIKTTERKNLETYRDNSQDIMAAQGA
jgi:hypothetical protein